jgi:predicted dehydrogenase
MPDAACRVALVGAGYMAREHARALSDIPGVQLVGITSRTRSTAQSLASQFNMPMVCNSPLELFARTQAELVVVAVSELSMAAVALECCRLPWTVLLEKPPGLNVEEAEAIQAVAKKNRRGVFVALNRRFYASTRAALTDLKGRQGRRFIQVLDQEDEDQARALGFPVPVVDQWMYANSIHVVDYLRLFGRGPVRALNCVVPWNPHQPGVVVAQVVFESGDIGVYEAIWNGPGPWSVSVVVPSQRWELRPLEQAAYQPRGERKLHAVAAHPWDQAFKPGLRRVAEQAVAAVQGQPTELPSLDDALETMRLIRDIYTPDPRTGPTRRTIQQPVASGAIHE